MLPPSHLQWVLFCRVFGTPSSLGQPSSVLRATTQFSRFDPSTRAPALPGALAQDSARRACPWGSMGYRQPEVADPPTTDARRRPQPLTPESVRSRTQSLQNGVNVSGVLRVRTHPHATPNVPSLVPYEYSQAKAATCLQNRHLSAWIAQAGPTPNALYLLCSRPLRPSKHRNADGSRHVAKIKMGLDSNLYDSAEKVFSAK